MRGAIRSAGHVRDLFDRGWICLASVGRGLGECQRRKGSLTVTAGVHCNITSFPITVQQRVLTPSHQLAYIAPDRQRDGLHRVEAEHVQDRAATSLKHPPVPAHGQRDSHKAREEQDRKSLKSMKITALAKFHHPIIFVGDVGVCR